jgi:hypothetical protein
MPAHVAELYESSKFIIRKGAITSGMRKVQETMG